MITFDNIDKIYFLHLSDRYDREIWLNTQINKMNFPQDKVNIWWTCRRNFINDIWEKFPYLNKGNYITDRIKNNPTVGGGVFNCAFEHYTIIRTSYERGFNHILVCEDDIQFNVDLELFKKFISLVPDNYGICKFVNRYWVDNQIERNVSTVCKEIPNENTIIENPYIIINPPSWSTCCYLLDRVGMKEIINTYNQNFQVADQVFENVHIPIYACNYNIIQNQDYNCKPHEYLWSDLWQLNPSEKWNRFK